MLRNNDSMRMDEGNGWTPNLTKRLKVIKARCWSYTWIHRENAIFLNDIYDWISVIAYGLSFFNGVILLFPNNIIYVRILSVLLSFGSGILIFYMKNKRLPETAEKHKIASSKFSNIYNNIARQLSLTCENRKPGLVYHEWITQVYDTLFGSAPDIDPPVMEEYVRKFARKRRFNPIEAAEFDASGDNSSSDSRGSSTSDTGYDSFVNETVVVDKKGGETRKEQSSSPVDSDVKGGARKWRLGKDKNKKKKEMVISAPLNVTKGNYANNDSGIYYDVSAIPLTEIKRSSSGSYQNAKEGSQIRTLSNDSKKVKFGMGSVSDDESADMSFEQNDRDTLNSIGNIPVSYNDVDNMVENVNRSVDDGGGGDPPISIGADGGSRILLQNKSTGKLQEFDLPSGFQAVEETGDKLNTDGGTGLVIMGDPESVAKLNELSKFADQLKKDSSFIGSGRGPQGRKKFRDYELERMEMGMSDLLATPRCSIPEYELLDPDQEHRIEKKKKKPKNSSSSKKRFRTG